MQADYVFSSESFTAGHPDKLCDQVSDAIVGTVAAADPMARISAECALSTGIAFLSVMHRSRAPMNLVETARSALLRAGYTGPPFDARTCSILLNVQTLAREIVDDGEPAGDAELSRIVAQDPATVFGYACTDTAARMPLPIWLAHKLARRLHHVYQEHRVPGLTPDGKSQVAVEYRGRRPARIHGLTLVTSRTRLVPSDEPRIREAMLEEVVRAAFRDEEIQPDGATRIAIDPEGPLVPGGPAFHAGLTGRKTASDTYGGIARHGGAALSGKDVFRVDRSGAYAARWVAKNVVAAALADACEVQISYAIGLAEPVSVQVETYGTCHVPEDEIAERIRRVFDLRVGSIVRALRLRDLARVRGANVFARLAAYGHVGRTDLDLPWEAVDRADELR
jgi:S-adenosylmethionine synthetase